MDKKKANKTRAAIAYISGFLIIVIGIIVGIVFVGIKGMGNLTPVPGVLLIGGIVELLTTVIIEAKKEKDNKNVIDQEPLKTNNKKPNGQDSKNNANNNRHFSGGDKYFRNLDNIKINQFDQYVAKNFPELPFDNFLTNKQKMFEAYTLAEIREIGIEMQKHLGLEDVNIVIDFGKLDKEHEVGNFLQRDWKNAEIKIENSKNSPLVLATLAHEMSHAYQAFKNKPAYDVKNTKVSEEFTDILTYYLGFKDLVVNGYYTEFDNKRIKLGYIESGDFMYAEQIYNNRTSSINSYKKDKQEVSEKINAIKIYMNTIVENCQKLKLKKLSDDDLIFVNSCLYKYSEGTFVEYIRKIEINTKRNAYIKIKMDIIGLEIKFEELMEDYKKIERIYDFIFQKIC